ncbi:ATP-binding protein, partial [Streptomyces sp. NPDC059851]|uniref:ATP-binding protein n=1 Tax=Streptomyces sp. NPDC059851 TaxID=3346971 RepID=UPI00366650BB
MGSDFVGREAELALLAQQMDAAAQGTGSVVLLTGPAGIGKSTLAAEALRRRAGPAGIGIVRGHCPRDAVAPPLWPWRRALRLAGAGAWATAALPAQRAGTPPPGAGTATARAAAAAARFLELAAMAEALADAAAANGRGLVVVLEDLHWADAA